MTGLEFALSVTFGIILGSGLMYMYLINKMELKRK